MNVKLPLFLVRQNSVPYVHELQFGSNELRDLMQQYPTSIQFLKSKEDQASALVLACLRYIFSSTAVCRARCDEEEDS